MLSYSNSKLQKSGTKEGLLIAVWNLPAGSTCPGAGICKDYCYAQKGHYRRFRLNEGPYQDNLELSKSKEFIEVLSLAIEVGIRKANRQGKRLAIRVHSAGDFYSIEYLGSWTLLAKAFPNVLFYAYSKSYFAWELFAKGKLPPNFRIIQSFGSLFDSRINRDLPHALIVKEGESIPEGYADATEDDAIAILANKIALRFH